MFVGLGAGVGISDGPCRQLSEFSSLGSPSGGVMSKDMYAKKFGDAVKDAIKDHNLSMNLEASHQQPPVVPEQELGERDSAAENGRAEGGNISVGKEATL